MKKYFKILLTQGVFLYFVVVGINQNVYGQVPDCEGDPCVNMASCATWVTPNPLVITPDPNCPTCTIKVYYKYRDNSNCLNICPGSPEIEFQIDMILTYGSCFNSCNGNPPQYQYGDMDKLYMIGLFYLVKEFSLPNMNGNCGPVFGNYKGTSCKKEHITPSGDVYILTCHDYECCIQNLQYCVNGTQETLIKTDLVVPTDNCQDDPDGLTCEYSCLWDWEDALIPKRAILNNNPIDKNYQLNFQKLNDKILLNLSGKLDGRLNIEVFNSNAQTLVNNSFNVHQDTFENIIQNNFISGAYYLIISLNGQVIKAHKFNIVK